MNLSKLITKRNLLCHINHLSLVLICVLLSFRSVVSSSDMCACECKIRGNPEIDPAMALWAAVRSGDIKNMELLLKQKFWNYISPSTIANVLALASESGNLECVELLLEHIDIESHVYCIGEALKSASQFGRSECVKLLLLQIMKSYRRSSASYHIGEAIVSASEHNCIECLELLLEHYNLVRNSDSRRLEEALRLASILGHSRCVELLMKAEQAYSTSIGLCDERPPCS